MATRHLSAATLPVPLSFACSACSSHCFSLVPSFSLRVSPSSPIAHCHPSMCAILLLAPPKNICLPFYRCWFAWQLWQRQIALLAKLRSGYARPERESERERPSGSGKWERARAKRARYNDAWLPRQQRQRQRNGDCDCGCRCCSYLCCCRCY